jgi:hypothetical protein
MVRSYISKDRNHINVIVNDGKDMEVDTKSDKYGNVNGVTVKELNFESIVLVPCGNSINRSHLSDLRNLNKID